MRLRRDINPKEQAFIIEYIKDFNATKAAARAGYSAKTANEQGARLLAKVSIQNELQKLTSRLEEESILKVKDLQGHLMKIIKARVTNIVHFNESGVSFVKNSDDIPEIEKDALESIEVIESHQGNDKMTLRTRVKIHDKLKAIELYGRTIGAFSDKFDLTASFETHEERIRRLRGEETHGINK